MKVVKLLAIMALIKGLWLNTQLAHAVNLVSPATARSMMLTNLRVLTWCMATAARVAFGP